MGKTLVIFKITVFSIEKLNQTAEAIRQLKTGEVKDVKREPIGFGIEIIKTAVLIPEKQDNVLDEVTQALKAIPNVSEVEVENMTLL